jgi:L-threonylcarbamoyladenylate synthase
MTFKEDIENSLKILHNGGVILYPTDTVWGIGCDATNSSAVDKIVRIKTRRRENKSLIILVNSYSMLERYVSDIPEAATNILEVSDKPITIIYPKAKNLVNGICGKDGSVGIRICMEKFCNELITRFRRPIVSTSANIGGEPSPSNFSNISEAIICSVDYIVNYRQDDRQKFYSSPVIKIEHNGIIKIIRK